MKVRIFFPALVVWLAAGALPLFGPWDRVHAGTAQTPFLKGNFRALIIGNNEYRDPEGLWVPLKTPIRDADAVAQALQRDYGFSAQNVLVLKDATRAQILSALTHLAKSSRENDSILIYYAGHGYSDSETKEAYWVPVDATGREDHTYVGNATIKTKLGVIADRARHVFLVSDSCFSGSLLREGHRGIRPTERNDQYYEKVAQKKSVQILAAGGLEYVDDNYKGTGHSPFTYFFLKQLEDNKDRHYSATELSVEVAKAVANNVYQTPEKGVLHGAGDNSGEFFFLNVRTSRAEEPGTKEPTPNKAEGLDPEAEMWALVKESNNPSDIRSFLAAFPQGRLAAVAQLKLRQLERLARAPGDGKNATDAKEVPLLPSSGPKLALFPGFFENDGKKAYGKALDLIGELLIQSKAFSRIQSCYPFRKNQGFSEIRRQLHPESLWKEGGLFSLPEPETRRVCEEAKALGADAVLMYHLNVQKQDSRLVVYAIDVNKQKVHVAKESSIMWRLDGDRVTKTLTEQVLGEYKRER